MEPDLRHRVCRAFRFFFLYVLVSGKIPDEKPGVVSHYDWEKLKLWKSVGNPLSVVSMRDLIIDGKNVKLLEVKCPLSFFKLSFVRALSGKMISRENDYAVLYAWLKNNTGDVPSKFIYGTYQEPVYEHVTVGTTHMTCADECMTLSYRFSHKLFFHPIIQNLPPDNSISVMIRSILWRTILHIGLLEVFDFGMVRAPAGWSKHLTQQHCESVFESSFDHYLSQLDTIQSSK